MAVTDEIVVIVEIVGIRLKPDVTDIGITVIIGLLALLVAPNKDRERRHACSL